MFLIIHIVIALASLAYSGYSYLAPSKNKLRVSYGLVAATLTTGTYLVVSTHSPLAQACLSGLAYLAVVSTGLVSAHLRLAKLRS